MSLKGLIEFATKEQIRLLKKQRDEEIKKEVLNFITENKRASFRELSDNLNHAKVFIAKALFGLKAEGKTDEEYEIPGNSMVLITFLSVDNGGVRTQ